MSEASYFQCDGLDECVCVMCYSCIIYGCIKMQIASLVSIAIHNTYIVKTEMMRVYI